MSFYIKRDITTSNFPAPDQVEVGELVINSNTGIMYTKLVNGSVVKFLSVPVSESLVPSVVFADHSTFCCNGDTLTATVSNLLENDVYTYEFTNLNDNSVVFSGDTSGNLLPLSSATRSASVLFSVNGSQPITLIKFAVKKNNVVIAENIASICCQNCEVVSGEGN
jgi:hypothetical protein